jgi:hypothetical protein
VREDAGECPSTGDENAWTSAIMQAFKRACSPFGLGRYHYNLPTPWVDYDQGRRQIKHPAGAARLIEEQTGLLEK